jgi:GNAT superfamily N-acetyltransferase
MIEVKQIDTKKGLREFEEVPEKLFGNDPYFVPPFPGSIVKLIAPGGVFARNGDVIPFIAYRDGKVVGRIAAVENRSHNKYHQDKVGFFGFFDFVNEKAVAEALFSAAKSELRRRGLTVARGPYNPSVNDEMGLLTEGFESSPMVLMPYNPSYYLSLYESLGLQPARDFYAFYMPGNVEAPERILKIVDRVKRSTGLTLRPLSLKHLDRDLKIIHELYNETLNRNWGFVPLSLDDLQDAAKELKVIVDPELVMIAEKGGQPAGFSLVIPNINEFMWRTKKSPKWLRILKFVWMLKTQRPKEARLTVLGVKPEYRNKGIGALFYAESLLKGGQKFVGGELSWVEANNQEIISGITVMGAKQYKTYRVYETPVGNA